MTAQQARAVLGLDARTDAIALRQAFNAAVKASHPDRPGGDPARLRAVVEAYRLLQAGPPPPEPPSTVVARAARLVITPTEAVLGAVRCLARAQGGATVRLPAGLRAGDWVQLGGRLLAVSVKGCGATSVLGDHLCITVSVEPALLRTGGRVGLATPKGARDLWISAADGPRGLARVRGEGLPARGGRPCGDLFVRLTPAAAEAESPAQTKLRRFTADWAA